MSTACRRAGVALAELQNLPSPPQRKRGGPVNARATIPTNVAEYRMPRRSLSSGSPKAATRWRGMTAEGSGATISETSIPDPAIGLAQVFSGQVFSG
jgi:hypothetical protein